MSSQRPADTEAELVDRLAVRGQLHPNTLANYTQRRNAYLSWLAERGEDDCITERKALLYLVAHREQWGHAYSKIVINALRYFCHERDGKQVPWPDASTYLSGLRSEKGSRSRPPTEPLLPETARTALANLPAAGLHTATTAFAPAAMLALLRLDPDWLGERGALHPVQLLRDVDWTGSGPATETRLKIVHSRGTVEVEAGVDPFLFSLLATGWNALAAAFGRPKDAVSSARATMDATWRRAGFTGRVDIASLSALSAGDSMWLLSHIDRALGRDLRDRAMLLVGLGLAARHGDLQHIRIEHIEALADDAGLRLLIDGGKTDQQGVGRWANVLHVCDEVSSSACPACALVTYLFAVTRSQRRTSGPLFATFYRGQWRAMTRQAASLRYQKLLARAGVAGLKVSTRSIRAGRIADLSHQNAQPFEICQVSGHRDPNSLLHYLRDLDPSRWMFQLNLPIESGGAVEQ